MQILRTTWTDAAIIHRSGVDPKRQVKRGFSWAAIRPSRLGPTGVIVASTVVTALLAVPAPQSQAFLPQNHERITRDGLPPGEVDDAAYLQIFAGPRPGPESAGQRSISAP